MQREKEFEEVCTRYLETLGLSDLRAYGRYVGLRSATSLKKAELIKEIVKALCGKNSLSFSNRGAPSKNNSLDMQVVKSVEEMQKKYLDRVFISQKELSNPSAFENSFKGIKEVALYCTVDTEGKVAVFDAFLQRMGVEANEELEQKLYQDEDGELLIVLRKMKA